MHFEDPVVAVLDDEENIRVALRRLLSLRGYTILTFETGRDLICAVGSGFGIRCVILDLHMPEMNGFDILEQLAGNADSVPIVVITGHDQAGNSERARRLGAHSYLTKPVDAEQLVSILDDITKTKRSVPP